MKIDQFFFLCNALLLENFQILTSVEMEKGAAKELRVPTRQDHFHVHVLRVLHLNQIHSRGAFKW